MKRPVTGLGRGLSALIDESLRPGDSHKDDASGRGGVQEVEVARIRPNPAQPRSYFDEASITELADSIRERGVLQPILLRPDGDGFQIIAGERRWRAAQRAKLHTIPAIVREIDEAGTAELALIENVQREDLNAIEEAQGYQQLIERHGYGQEMIGQLVHKSRSHVANLLRLLDLTDPVKEMLLRGVISMGHARAVAAAPDPEALAAEIVAKGLSVRQAEALAKRVRPGTKSEISRAGPRSPDSADPDLAALERQLADMLGIKVTVSNKGSGGAVGLYYSSLDQLDMICQRLSGEPI